MKSAATFLLSCLFSCAASLYASPLLTLFLYLPLYLSTNTTAFDVITKLLLCLLLQYSKELLFLNTDVRKCLRFLNVFAVCEYIIILLSSIKQSIHHKNELMYPNISKEKKTRWYILFHLFSHPLSLPVFRHLMVVIITNEIMKVGM